MPLTFTVARGLTREVTRSLTRASGGGGASPFDSVVLLLDFAGADEATDITDLSNSAHVESMDGAAQVDTGLTFLGENTILSLNNADVIVYPDSADWDFGTGDFTIEFGWYFAGSVPAWAAPMGGGSGTTGWSIVHQNGIPQIRWTNGVTLVKTETWAPVHSTWYHFVVCREGTNLRIFVDGVQLGTPTTDSTNITGATGLHLMEQLAATNTFDGSIGAVRIAKGHAFYTENFTAPTEFYPTS